MPIAALGIALVLSLVLRACGVAVAFAWLLGCTVVPILVLVVEFMLPYEGGGASMWPVALLFGGLYGAIATGAGVGVGNFLRKRTSAD